MKKTLIALAALGVVGAASAQATVSGSVTAGYQTTTTQAGVTTSGFGLDSAYINVAATEDLGGGLTASASISTQSQGDTKEDTSTTATDNIIGWKTAAGSLKVGSAALGTFAYNFGKETPNGIIGISPVADLTYLDGFAASKGGTENVTWTSPAMGPVSFTFLIGSDDFGIGQGKSSTYVGYLNYADGPVKAGINYTIPNKESSIWGTFSQRTRLTASYDMGVAMVGVGMSTGLVKGTDQATKVNDQTTFAVTVPMGAWSFGLAYGSDKNAKDGSDTDTGTVIGAKYALSKRTSLNFQNASSNATSTNKTTTVVTMSHAF
jgi:predicted porin